MRRQFLVVIFSFVFGALGGIVANALRKAPSVHAQDEPNDIRVRNIAITGSLFLYDSEGRTRAALRNRDDAVQLVLIAPDQSHALILSSDDITSNMAMLDSDGTPRVNLIHYKNGDSILALVSAKKSLLFSLASKPDRTGTTMEFFDRGVLRRGLGIQAVTQATSIQFSDPKGRLRLRVGTTPPDQKGEVRMLDSDENIVFKVPE